MDEAQINQLIQKCKNLKHVFYGVFAADNFPHSIPVKTFIIINASKKTSFGTHWLLLYNYNGLYVFADPLGLPLISYRYIFERLQSSKSISSVVEINKFQPIQEPSSNRCGLFCIYIAHVIDSSVYELPSTIGLINENELARFMRHML